MSKSRQILKIIFSKSNLIVFDSCFIVFDFEVVLGRIIGQIPYDWKQFGVSHSICSIQPYNRAAGNLNCYFWLV